MNMTLKMTTWTFDLFDKKEAQGGRQSKRRRLSSEACLRIPHGIWQLQLCVGARRTGA